MDNKKTSTLTDFGKFCKTVRIMHELSSPKWAELLETSAQTVTAYEHGRKELTTTFKLKVADVLNAVDKARLSEFNEQFLIPDGVIYINHLNESQKDLVQSVLNGSVKIVDTE